MDKKNDVTCLSNLSLLVSFSQSTKVNAWIIHTWAISPQPRKSPKMYDLHTAMCEQTLCPASVSIHIKHKGTKINLKSAVHGSMISPLGKSSVWPPCDKAIEKKSLLLTTCLSGSPAAKMIRSLAAALRWARLGSTAVLGAVRTIWWLGPAASGSRITNDGGLHSPMEREN